MILPCSITHLWLAVCLAEGLALSQHDGSASKQQLYWESDLYTSLSYLSSGGGYIVGYSACLGHPYILGFTLSFWTKKVQKDLIYTATYLPQNQMLPTAYSLVLVWGKSSLNQSYHPINSTASPTISSVPLKKIWLNFSKMPTFHKNKYLEMLFFAALIIASVRYDWTTFSE